MRPLGNAHLTTTERLAMVMAVGGGDISTRRAAEKYRIREVTVRKLIQLFEAGGIAALEDRPSTAQRIHAKSKKNKAGTVPQGEDHGV
jgi:transposase